MDKPFRISKKKKKRRRKFYSSPSEDSCLGYTIFTKKSAPEECLIQGYMFLLHQVLQIIMMKDISENYKVYLMLLVCARLQALEVGT